jgi:L-rhamnose mutarotase
VLAQHQAAHVHNHAIFPRQPENLRFGFWKYDGDAFEVDMLRSS